MLARQVDRIVSEPQLDLVERKVGEGNGLSRNDVAVAVVAGERASAVMKYRKFPHLKRLGGLS